MRYEEVAEREKEVHGNFGVINYISTGILKLSAQIFLLVEPG